MKSVIDGKLYDTEKAEEIARWDNHIPSNLDRIIKTLYLTKKGNFFLEIFGGARTFYDTEPPIKALTDEEAKKWLEDHGKAEAYIELFDPEEA